jgi:hypothetical protein
MVKTEASVQLQNQASASSILHKILSVAIDSFPAELNIDAWPDETAEFRKRYVTLIPRFEAVRLASPKRLEIARQMTRATQQTLVWQDGEETSPFDDVLNSTAKPLELKRVQGEGVGGWQPVFDDYNIARSDLINLGETLMTRNCITEDAAKALSWLQNNALDNGEINLSGRKIAILGAAAEMASTQHFLKAGADVLWLDLSPPPADWLHTKDFSGILFYPEQNANLLTQPREILATLLTFANGGTMDICLYAYAQRQARELRLSAVMNTLVDKLPQDLIASVTMLISPAATTALNENDLHAMNARRNGRPAWEALLDNIGLLGRGYTDGTSHAGVTRTIAGIQGTSYQAAQYLGKIVVAECWANHGQPGVVNPRPLRVSANTAAITRTRSLEHPIFEAAFGGAEAFQVETFAPEQSQCLNGLLTIHDWLHPELPVPGRVRVHGGIHTLPYPLEDALKIAAAIGFTRSPTLLGRLLSNR